MIKNIFLFVSAVTWCGQLHAAVIPGVTVSAVSSQYAAGVDQRRATNLLGGVGLYGDVHTTLAAGSMWMTTNNTVNSFTNASVTFDLGSLRTVNRMKIWNYNEFGTTAAVTNRGIQFMAVSYSTDNVTFTTNLPNLLLNRAPAAYTNFGQTIDLAAIQAQYIRFNVLTNYGTSTDYRVGLSKVQFIDDTVIPTIKLATRSLFGDRVAVQFSEAVQTASATNIANYTLQSGATTVTISNIVVNTYNDTVTLRTAPLDSNLVYTISAQNIRDLGNAVTFNSTPVTVENELSLWLKADAGVVADGSGLVTQWNDQSGFGNNAFQTTNVNPPTLVANVVNGNPAIHFDGLTNHIAGIIYGTGLEVTNSSSAQANRDLTLYVVLSTDTLVPAQSAQSPISKCPVNVPATFDLQILKTTGKLRLLRGNGSGNSSFDSSAAIAANQFYLISYVVRDTNATTYLNGNFNGTATLIAGLGDSGTPIRIGARQDWFSRFAGNLAEVMMFRGALTDAERTTLENSLGAKYGISVIALSITEQPQNVTAQVGKAATFWVNAIAGSPTINYQWQSNNVNIAGATNSVYTTPALTVSASGAAYRVIASTPLGITSTSSPATLTVVVDTQGPTVFSATKKTGNSNDIVLVYSEAVTAASATNLSNYSLNNGGSILSATLGSTSNQVILTTAGLNPTTTYLLSIQNVQDLFANNIAPTTSLILAANMSLWMKADASVITNSSGLVSQWLDQTANTNNATQFSSAGNRPTLVANSINGQPALSFNGSNYLQAVSSPSLAISGNISIFVMTRIATLGVNSYAHLIGKTTANRPASFDYYVHNGGNGNPLYRGDGTGTAFSRATALPSFGVAHLMNVVMNGTNVSHFLDGAANGTGTISTNMVDAGKPLRIGSRDSLDVFMNGEIAEVIIFNSAVSQTERQAINSYLGFKYFPFSITQQPTNTSKLEGQTATFIVAASAGPASFNYQWQKNGANILNATNTSYTTPTLVQADSGSTYRVSVIPLTAPAILSDVATLTVSPDAQAPTVLSVGTKVWNTNQIVVIFSEAVKPSSATNLSNYALDNGATIISVVMGDTPNQVVLTVTGMVPGTVYSLTVQNVQDLFNNTIVQATVPSGVYPTTLSLWLKADAGVTADGQNFVSTWNDQSGNANHATGTSGNSPLFTNVLSHPALNFDGTNQYLAILNSPTMAIVGDISIYVVAQFRDYTSTTNEIGLIEKTGGTFGNQPASYDFYVSKTTGLPKFYRGDGTLNGSITGTNAPSLGAPHILSVTMAGQSAAMYLDSTLNGSGTITAPIADSGSAIGIGTRNDLRPKMNGDIYEVLMFSSVLSNTERAALDSYLSSKYGIGLLPRITSTLSANNAIVLSWPTSNFVLETTSDLGVTFSPATNTVTSFNGTNSATINPTDSHRYYRLHLQ